MGNIIKIWKDDSRPVVFCHIEGLEKSQTVSTDEGNEQSKSNDAERDHAVKVKYTNFLFKCNIIIKMILKAFYVFKLSSVRDSNHYIIIIKLVALEKCFAML